MSAWARRRHRNGGLSNVEHDTVLALLAGVPGESDIDEMAAAMDEE